MRIGAHAGRMAMSGGKGKARNGSDGQNVQSFTSAEQLASTHGGPGEGSARTAV